MIDDLSYTYTNGNQVSQVEDDGTTRGFANGEEAGSDEYVYNEAGQLTKDENKGIASITYNLLGKAQRVQFEDGRIVDYAYMATGTKVQMDVTQNSTTATTQYVGGAVYENGTLQQLASPEGRLVKNGSTFEYQYAIADHQGNTRLVFSSVTPTPEAPTATMEPANETDERAHFLKYDDVRLVNAALFDHTNNGTTHHSVRLSGTEAETYGLVRSLQVGPGDKVKAEVFAKYVDPDNNNWNAALSTLMTNVASAASGTVLDGEMYNTPEGSTLPFPGVGHGTQEGDAPKAYLNWLVFDNNFKPIPALSGYRRMTTAAKEGGTDVPHEKLEMAEITIEEAGYVYIYYSNEQGTPLEVYFDDFSVTHTKTNIVQYNEYYPYGMQTYASWTRDNSSNNFLYNAGSELNSTTNNYEMHFREYDPVLARMTAVDPVASKYASLTPYNYAFNDPVTFNDPSGADPTGGLTWGIEHDPRVAPVYNYETRRYEGGSIGHWTEHVRDVYSNLALMGRSQFENLYNVDLDTEEGKDWLARNANSPKGFTDQDALAIGQALGLNVYVNKNGGLSYATVASSVMVSNLHGDVGTKFYLTTYSLLDADQNNGGSSDGKNWATDLMYEVNKFNPIANVYNAISTYLTGQDSYGVKGSKADATLLLASAIPIFKVGSAGQAAFNIGKKAFTYLDDLALKTDLYHNFPLSLDKQIIQNGAWSQRLKDGANWYELPGQINGVKGMFQLGVNEAGLIFHRNFVPFK